MRSITTKPIRFNHTLILKDLDCWCDCKCDDDKSKEDARVASTIQPPEESDCDCDDDEPEEDARVASIIQPSEESVAIYDHESLQPSQSQQSQPNANINAGSRSRSSTSQHVNVGYRSQSFIQKEECNVGYRSEKEECLKKPIKQFGSHITFKAKDPPKDPPRKPTKNPKVCTPKNNIPCKPCDSWKPTPPPDMEQETFERYVKEIVRTLKPVIPPNPFAVQRETCVSAEPDCDCIRVELERLLETLDDSPPCPSYTVHRSGCWPC